MISISQVAVRNSQTSNPFANKTANANAVPSGVACRGTQVQGHDLLPSVRGGHATAGKGSWAHSVPSWG